MINSQLVLCYEAFVVQCLQYISVLCVAIEYTQHLIEQKSAQEKKLEELRKEVLALKIMKS